MCNSWNSELLAHIRENDKIALSMNPLAFLVKQHEIVRRVGGGADADGAGAGVCGE